MRGRLAVGRRVLVPEAGVRLPAPQCGGTPAAARNPARASASASAGLAPIWHQFRGGAVPALPPAGARPRDEARLGVRASRRERLAPIAPGLRGLRRDPKSTSMMKIFPLRTVKTRVSSMFMSGPRPVARQLILPTTRSPAAMKSVITSALSTSECFAQALILVHAGLPADESVGLGPALKRRPDDIGVGVGQQTRPGRLRCRPSSELARPPRSPATSPTPTAPGFRGPRA